MNFFTTILFIFIYSFLGYIYETLINLKNKVPINSRGFLYGPLRPIYGFGCILLIFVFYNFHIDTLPLFFLVGFFSCTVEYISSYILEKKFNKKYWDYSNNLFNLDGRVCALGFVVFGVFGLFLLNFLHPILLDIVKETLSQRAITYSVFTLLFFTTIDLILSLYNIKHSN